MSQIDVPSPSRRPTSGKGDPAGRRPTAGRPREAFAGFVALAAVIAAVIMSAVGILARDAGEPVILVVLAVLAMTGVFFMFATAAGLVRFAEEGNTQNLLEAWAEADGEGLHLVSPEGWVAYSSSAFKRLLGVDDVTDGRWLDRALLHSSGGLESAYRLAQAAATRQPWTEDVELDGGAHLTIAVSHLTAPDGELLIAWRVTERPADATAPKGKAAAGLAATLLDGLPCAALMVHADGTAELNARLSGRLGLDTSRRDPIALRHLTNRATAQRITDLLSGLEPGRSARTTVTFLDGNGHEQQLPLAIAGASRLPGSAALAIVTDEPAAPAEASTAAVAAPVSGPEATLSRFFEDAPVAIAAVDRHGRIGRSNPAFAALFSTSAGPAPQSLLSLVHDQSRDTVKLAFASASAGVMSPSRAPVDFRYGKDGSKNGRLYFSGGPIGANDGVVLYAIDTTEQKELEAQFAQSQKMQAVGELAGGIAHDFRNALMVITGYSDLLLGNHRPNDPAYADIMAIKNAANRTAGMVHQLLAFSRRQTLMPGVLSLSDILSNFKATFARVLGEQYTFRVDPGVDLWPVKADATQLDHVIMNLAVNARDAMPKGGKLEILARNVAAAEVERGNDKGMEPGDYVLMQVRDNGSGMPPDVLEKIFQPFFTTKEVGKGTGLGLSMVYGIVKQTGGFIYCDSTPDAGTTFRIYLPRHAGEVSAPAKGEKQKERVKDMTGSGLVLLVEDEDDVRRFAKRALERKGFTVIGTGSGREALEAIDAQTKAGKSFNIVVSDIVMPEMDGPTLLHEIRKTQPDLPFIFMSGYAEGALESLGDAKKYSFLSKPVNLTDLVEAVKTGLAAS